MIFRIIFLLLVAPNFFISQNNPANAFYEAAGKALAAKEYFKADSLYTLSLQLEPHPDAFFNRAACRLIINNKKGYCEDLACAAAMKDNESTELFCKECGTRDTLLPHQGDYAKKFTNCKYNISFNSSCFVSPLIGGYGANTRLVGFGWSKSVRTYVLKQDSLAAGETMAEFPGGISALYGYLTRSINFPPEAIEMGISGKVYLKFVVNEFGFIEHITLEKGIKDCFACDKEALRVLANMPRWIPAKLSGTNVNAYMTFPIVFKIR